MKVFFGNKERKIDVKAVRPFSFGLMFKFNKENAENLFFSFRRQKRIAITSLFCFFPFLVLWLDENKNVIGVDFVKPFMFSLKPKKKVAGFIEIPINRRNKEILGFFRRGLRKV